MRSTLVLSNDSHDGITAVRWANDEARRARLVGDKCDALGGWVLKAYQAAYQAFFGDDARAQKLMVCLDLRSATPRFELISDGEQARGAVASAQGLGHAERRRAGLLDGLTCVAVPA